MAKIAIDCDGVLANFTKAYFDTANEIWPGRCDNTYQPKGWDDFGDLTKADNKAVWERIKATANWWMKLDAYAQNMGALITFLYTHHGHDVWICTSRTPTVGSTVAFQTNVWARACGLDPFGNYFGIITVDNWPDKRPIYKAMGVEFSIDDKKETVEDCDKLSGHTANLLDRPWNQDAVVKNRIGSLAEFLPKVVQS